MHKAFLSPNLSPTTKEVISESLQMCRGNVPERFRKTGHEGKKPGFEFRHCHLPPV